MAEKEIINWAAQVLKLESEALSSAANRLDVRFFKAVSILSECRGKIVVSGLGKSGHIARKIAATLASTGSPAFFLHPTEALHGDMGMIDKQDVVLAIAHSGETSEVLEVVKHAKRLGIGVISITGKTDSTLEKFSDVGLDASVEIEACPLNLAPTTSSTLTLALGDALAVSLMKSKGFDEHDFAKLHPGGSLGKKLALTSEYMRPEGEFRAVKLNSNFHEILEGITKPNFGIVGVLNEKGELAGAVTDGDLRRGLSRFW